MLLAAGADRDAKDTNFHGTPLGWARALGRTALAAMQNQLAGFGHTVVTGRMSSKANAAERTATGWQGAADPRSEGVALGE